MPSGFTGDLLCTGRCDMGRAIHRNRKFFFGAAALLVFAASVGTTAATPPSPLKAENLVIVTIDGLRREEVFGGADEQLLGCRAAASGVRELERTRREFWRDTPQARREALMPFLWSILVPQGQLF